MLTSSGQQHHSVDTMQHGENYVMRGWPSIQAVLIAATMQHWWTTLFPFVALRTVGWT